MFVAPDPVSSGRPYKISGNAAGAPEDLSRFIGEASFTIDRDGSTALVLGSGTADETGVRFYQKDLEHSGKDIRTWHISEDATGCFVATPIATC